jgi:hypothetical protein
MAAWVITVVGVPGPHRPLLCAGVLMLLVVTIRFESSGAAGFPLPSQWSVLLAQQFMQRSQLSLSQKIVNERAESCRVRSWTIGENLQGQQSANGVFIYEADEMICTKE